MSTEEYNAGPPTQPREAATVIVLRGGRNTLEVLLVRRTPGARFMGGVWVFPGGAVDDRDIPAHSPASQQGGSAAPAQDTGTPQEGESTAIDALRRAAARELREEAGIELADTSELIEFSRWITPAQVKRRFDTHFFLSALPPGQQPRVDGEECIEYGWFTPRAALTAHGAGEIALVFPTIKHLEQLDSFASVDALLAAARGREVQPVEPRILIDGGLVRVLLPGEPGY